MVYRRFSGPLFAGLALLATPAAADLESSMTAQVVERAAGGAEVFRPAGRVKPGETVEYRIVHRNGFDHALDGVAIVGPVPQGMELEGAAHSADIPAVFEVRGELDPDAPGEEWSTLPATKITVSADGARIAQPAEKADFTAVRWRLTAPLPGQTSVRHSYRTRVR